MRRSTENSAEVAGPLSVRAYEYGFATTPPLVTPSRSGRRLLGFLPHVVIAVALSVGLVELVRASGLVPHEYVAGSRPPSPRDRVERGPKTARPVIASKLYADYQADEKLADARYKGETLDVVGRVAGMDADLVGSLIVKIESPNPFAPTRAYLADVSAPPVRGTDVTLRCQGGGRILGSPVLRDCVLR